MAPFPTGTVTFLFTDIEGSTKLLQRLGDDYARVLGEHQALLRAAFAAHDGAEVDTQGDAFFVAFASALEALAAAAEATRALAAHEWPAVITLRVRMGLHTGTPQLVGDHYVGMDVHRAARIAAAGHGGQILLSATTRALVEEDLPSGVALHDLGAHRLKDLQRPEHITQLILPDPDLPSDFPPLKTLDTHQHNLPLQPTPLLDRVEQLATICDLLQRDDGTGRLVTLTGPGGIGKTRLAIQVAGELVGSDDSDHFADGVWYVRLSRLADPGLVVPTIAQTLGLKEQGGRSLAEILREHLAAQQRMLLVLDNFEQVVDAAGEVAALLAACPGLRVLVTSRTRLHLRGEREYPLAPLPLPPSDPGHLPPPEHLSQYAAVALFIERAQAAQPAFAVTAANAPAVAEICARLDGLPLAIELAAARVKLLPPEALLSRLSSRLKVLTGGARDLEERQQTMRNTLAWSEGVLAPQERVLFRRLAVFVGGCTLEAAEAICAAPEGAEPLELDLLDGLSALVDHSLVQQRTDGSDGEPRFGMLQVIREYAVEQLEASAGTSESEMASLRRAHADHYLALAERAEPELTGPEGVVWLRRLEREHDNLRAALSWGRDAWERSESGEERAEEIGLRLVAALGRFWVFRGHLREGRAWADALLAPAVGSRSESESGPETEIGIEPRMGPKPVDAGTGPGPGPGVAQMVPSGVRARALLSSGGVALWQGDDAAAERWLEQAVALGRAAGDLRTAARALNSLGVPASRRGDLERAAERYEQSLALFRQVGDRWGSAHALNNLGDVAVYQGHLERAATVFTEALTLFRQVGDRGNTAVCLENLGWVACKRGELAQAATLQREALTLFWEVGDLRQCAEALEYLASTAGVARQGARAARLLGVATAVRKRLGAPIPANEWADIEQAVAAARVALGEEQWQVAFAAGQALSLEEAIAEALRDSGPPG